MQQKEKKERKLSSRKLSKDLITNTIFKIIKEEVLEKFGRELTEEQIRAIASVPYQKLYDYIHNQEIVEGKGVRVPRVGAFYVKTGTIDTRARMKQAREEGYTGLEVARIVRLRFMDELNERRANGEDI